MSRSRHVRPSRAIGRTLMEWRRGRGLTLHRVAAASEDHLEPIAPDYLSRLERGELMPSLPKLVTLAGIYGIPVSQLIDLYEVEELRRLAPPKATYDILHRLGGDHLEKGEITEALACYLSALEVAKRENEDPRQLATAYNNAGHALAKGGRYLTAQHLLEEGLRLPSKPSTRILLLDNLAIVHYQLDNLYLADLLSREAVLLAESDGLLRPLTLSTRAAVLLDLRQLEQAEVIYRGLIREHEQEGREDRAIRHTYNLGHCLVEQGKVDEGLACLREAAARATESAEPNLRSTSQFFLGRCLYAIGRGQDSIAPLKAALRTAEKSGNRNVAFHSAFYLWKLARERGAGADEDTYEEVAERYRMRLQQRSEEARSFDSWLARRRRKARSRDNVKENSR